MFVRHVFIDSLTPCGPCWPAFTTRLLQPGWSSRLQQLRLRVPDYSSVREHAERRHNGRPLSKSSLNVRASQPRWASKENELQKETVSVGVEPQKFFKKTVLLKNEQLLSFCCYNARERLDRNTQKAPPLVLCHDIYEAPSENVKTSHALTSLLLLHPDPWAVGVFFVLLGRHLASR